MESSVAHLLAVLFAGGFSGLLSGLLGVTPGGILVPSLVLLGAHSQHQAQAISLAAQLLPTSLAGLRPYWQGGHRIAARWLLWLAIGFVPGTYLGARGAVLLSDRALHWSFVGYLGVLLLVSLRRKREAVSEPDATPGESPPNPALLLAIGVLAGASSGLLGIGGGLASIALLTALAGLTQHAAQALSLALAALPLALSAVYVYATGSSGIPWLDTALVIAGLLLGTYGGALLAARLSGTAMRRYFIALIGLMLVLMIIAAL